MVIMNDHSKSRSLPVSQEYIPTGSRFFHRCAGKLRFGILQLKGAIITDPSSESFVHPAQSVFTPAFAVLSTVIFSRTSATVVGLFSVNGT